MLLERPFLLIIVPFSILSGMFIFVGLTISPSLTPEYFAGDQMEVARIISNEGRVDLSRNHTYQSSRLRRGSGLDIPVYHLDRITVQARSNSKLVFLDGYELELGPYTQVVFEAWDIANKSGPIYLNMISGDYKVAKKGRAGSVYIVKDNLIYLPSKKPAPAMRTLYVMKSKPLKPATSMPPAESELESVKAEPATEQRADKRTNNESANSKSMKTALDTLSNEYIDQVIGKNVDQLKKCQSYAIRDNENSKGEIILGLAIAPRGKMESVTVIKSSLQNQKLESCVSEVFERTQFKPFEGPQIVRTFPIVFD